MGNFGEERPIKQPTAGLILYCLRPQKPIMAIGNRGEVWQDKCLCATWSAAVKCDGEHSAINKIRFMSSAYILEMGCGGMPKPPLSVIWSSRAGAYGRTGGAE